MKKPILLFLLTVILCPLYAQTVRIHTAITGLRNQVIFQNLGEEAIVMQGDEFPVPVFRMGHLEKVTLETRGREVLVTGQGKSYGPYPQVNIWVNGEDPRYLVYPPDRQTAARTYPNELEVRVLAGELQLINVAQMEEYIRGVVYAEAGHYKVLDFFKVQAVTARTYAIAHLGKHGREGFDVCDQTHCQAYKGLGQNAPLIDRAVEETWGEVIVAGPQNRLIEAVFSANCGGYTANSEDVWINEIEYLRAVSDHNYCEGSRSHAWHLMTTRWDFLKKLSEYHKTEVTEFEVEPDESGRVRRLILNGNPGLSVSGGEVRRIFRLKSSKFHLYESLGLLLVEGAGFGHGVGMCQDGAYFLAKEGMDYDKIIGHYYVGVRLVPMNEVGEEFVGGGD